MESKQEYDNPFDPAIAPGLSLIMLLRIYDVQMAQLTALNKGAAAKLHEVHANGGIVGPLPAFSNEEE